MNIPETHKQFNYSIDRENNLLMIFAAYPLYSEIRRATFIEERCCWGALDFRKGFSYGKQSFLREECSKMPEEGHLFCEDCLEIGLKNAHRNRIIHDSESTIEDIIRCPGKPPGKYSEKREPCKKKNFVTKKNAICDSCRIGLTICEIASCNNLVNSLSPSMCHDCKKDYHWCGRKYETTNGFKYCINCKKYDNGKDIIKLCKICTSGKYEHGQNYRSWSGNIWDISKGDNEIMHLMFDWPRYPTFPSKFISSLYCPHKPDYRLCKGNKEGLKQSEKCTIIYYNENYYGEFICKFCREEKENLAICGHLRARIYQPELYARRLCSSCHQLPTCVTCKEVFVTKDSRILQCPDCDAKTGTIYCKNCSSQHSFGSISYPYTKHEEQHKCLDCCYANSPGEVIAVANMYKLYHFLLTNSNFKELNNYLVTLLKLQKIYTPDNFELAMRVSCFILENLPNIQGKQIKIAIIYYMQHPEAFASLEYIHEYRCAMYALYLLRKTPRDIRSLILGKSKVVYHH